MKNDQDAVDMAIKRLVLRFGRVNTHKTAIRRERVRARCGLYLFKGRK